MYFWIQSSEKKDKYWRVITPNPAFSQDFLKGLFSGKTDR